MKTVLKQIVIILLVNLSYLAASAQQKPTEKMIKDLLVKESNYFKTETLEVGQVATFKIQKLIGAVLRKTMWY
jgi:hypothetical protein